MESRVENADLRSVRHQFLAGSDPGNIGRLMQRSHIAQAFDLLQDFFRDEYGFIEDFPAMYDSVADCIDFVHRLDDAVVRVNQGSQDLLDPVHMVRNDARQHNLVLAGRSVRQAGAFDPDSFDETLGNDGFVFHVDQLILNGRTATVYNKNLHC